MLEVQKERGDVIFLKHELSKKLAYLESELTKDRNIIKKWTISGKQLRIFKRVVVGRKD